MEDAPSFDFCDEWRNRKKPFSLEKNGILCIYTFKVITFFISILSFSLVSYYFLEATYLHY